MTDIKATYRADSASLNRIIASVSNQMTGLGTSRDKTRHVSINGMALLTQSELETLPRVSGMLRRLVCAYPVECADDWLTIRQIQTKDDDALEVDELEYYLEELEDGDGGIGAREAFKEASILGRQHGDGFVLVGLADGLDPAEPVDYNKIQSIEWLKVLDRYQIYPDLRTGDRRRPEFYQIYYFGGDKELSRKWHRSRVLRFSGNKVYDGSIRDNSGFHDSVLLTIFETWSAWQQGLMSGSAMLADYNHGIYRMEGLGKALEADLREKTNIRQQQIKQRLETVEMAKSVFKAVLLDKEQEDFEFVTRSYQGASAIMDLLKKDLVAEVDLPSYKLFNENNQSGNLSSAQTAGLAQRYDWAAHKNKWMQDNWVRPYTRLLKLAIAAKDSPINVETRIKVVPNAQVIQTPTERMEAMETMTRINESNVTMGIYTAKTVQKQYRQAEWTGEIIIDEDDYLDNIPTPEPDDEAT